MSTLKRVILSAALLLGLALSTPLITYASPLAYPTERLSGQDRVETALSISQKGWDSASTVILCEYSDYADSIASAPYAVKLNAPILLTEGTTLDPRVVTELQRLKPQQVILLGGTGCLKPSIEQQLKQLSFQWERIGGADRYETSILLAKRVNSTSLILANGDDFPDALSAASFAGIQQIPIVLTSKTFPDSVVKYYQEARPAHLIVIGGEGVIPSEALDKNNFTVETRLGGQDRYETNAKVASYMNNAYESDDLFLASGITFPDAVAGTVLAAKNKAPLLLTEKTDIPPSVYSILRTHMKVEPPADSSNSDPLNGNWMTGKITASGGLNLRATPSASGQALTVIPQGVTVELTGRQDQWYQTTYQGKTGWISAAYVTVQTLKGKSTASTGLNLRDTPASSGNILLTIPEGTTLDLTFKQDQWFQTTYQGKTGWISAAYVVLANSGQSAISSSSGIDLSVNGTVYILGGSGVISSTAQNIIEGKTGSQYSENLKAFPPLPSDLNNPNPPTPPSRGDEEVTPPPSGSVYNPASEVLVDPFSGIPAKSLTGKKIVIDPGHGGPDTGAIGPSQTYEKDNALAIALALRDILNKAGATVILTRDDDTSPASQYTTEIEDLKERVKIGNESKADLFISIHNDSFSNADVKGTSTYYSTDNPLPDESQRLANAIQTNLISTLNTNNRNVKTAGFYVLLNTTMPSVLIETAFISSPYEEARLQNPTFRKNVAAAIFHGIYGYYHS